MTGSGWRTRSGRAERFAVRIVAVVLVGWASVAVGLWHADTALQSGQSTLGDELSGVVVYAAPSHQDADATSTPESWEVGAPVMDPADATPTPTVFGGPPLPPVALPSPSPIAYTGDLCFGDEQVSFVPEEPRANNELLVAVTSRYPNKYPRLAGTEKATFVRERPGQIGYVWEWTIQVTWPGQHHYVFYVDSTVPCKKLDVTVRRQIPTVTPTRTPEPDNENNTNNENSR